MDIGYDILRKLLDCNKSLKLRFVDGTNDLEVLIYNCVVSTITLRSNLIEENSNVIYNEIVNLDGVTLYIPKIYIKE